MSKKIGLVPVGTELSVIVLGHLIGYAKSNMFEIVQERKLNNGPK